MAVPTGHEYTLEQVVSIVTKDFHKNIEEAFYEKLKPISDQITRQAARSLAQSLKGYCASRLSPSFERQIVLIFNKEETQI